MYIVKYSERVHMARMHELASASPPYERVPNILRYTFNNLFCRRHNQTMYDLHPGFYHTVGHKRNPPFVRRNSLNRTFHEYTYYFSFILIS